MEALSEKDVKMLCMWLRLSARPTPEKTFPPGPSRTIALYFEEGVKREGRLLLERFWEDKEINSLAREMGR